MEFIVKSQSPEKQKTDCLVLPLFQSARLSGAVEKLNQASKGTFGTLHKRGDLAGNVTQVVLLQSIEGLSAQRVLLLGVGKDGKISSVQYRELLQKMIATLCDTNAQDIVIDLNDIQVKDKDLNWKIRQVIAAFHFAFYRFDEYKSKKDPKLSTLRKVTFNVLTKKDVTLAQNAIEQGVAIVKGIELTKNLANVPANICTPTFLAEKAKKLAKAHNKISTAVLEEKDMRALKMGLLLSVTQGSDSSAKLITMEYRGARKDVKPIVLVGKGITFDTGGNSIKVPPNMIGMKYDMCGAATVFGVLEAASLLELPLNIIGVIPSCENMPGPSATRPEDIVTSMSGLTVEILNTDAEGRLILADALTYCERFAPDVVIDIATLTSACQLALGPFASGLMSNYQPLADALIQAGNQSSDRAWQLPLWEEYAEPLKSEFADLSNIPLNPIGGATIVAGAFLAKFTQKFHWAHLDVANTATTNSPKRGATGRPVALLVQYLINRCNAI
ncbi:MAG: leucyl aminopeptidase [Proteobacteria bacterium]|nr:leucyl aminopeptidase [Pseudomonadota bacterium]